MRLVIGYGILKYLRICFKCLENKLIKGYGFDLFGWLPNMVDQTKNL